MKVEDADAIAKEAVLVVGRKDQVRSQAHCLGLGNGPINKTSECQGGR